jgi:flagellar motor switch protein FliM
LIVTKVQETGTAPIDIQMPDRVLSQEEIDDVFRNLRDSPQDDDPAKRAQPYDFRRPDRIAKDQLRAIHILHENFARSLASSLSAYLRAYVVVNLVSVEQLSFMEFSQCLPSPSCLVSLGMKPYEGNAGRRNSVRAQAHSRNHRDRTKRPGRDVPHHAA